MEFSSVEKFVLDLLKSAKMIDVKPLTIPLDQHTKLYDNVLSGDLLPDPSIYRS